MITDCSERRERRFYTGAASRTLVRDRARFSGRPIRRNNFRKLTGWPHIVEALGIQGLHFHDLRHTGNQFAANSGAGLRDLIARMGHDSARAAMIYQHEARAADKVITDAIDAHADDETRRTTATTKAWPGRWFRLSNPSWLRLVRKLARLLASRVWRRTSGRGS